MTMASRSPVADPSRFVIGAAVGFRHVLEPILGFHERFATPHRRDRVLLVLVVLLALMAQLAYLLLVTVVFVVFFAADGCTRIVVQRGGDHTPELQHAAAALLATVNLAIKLALAVAFLIFGVVVYMIGNVMLAARN